MIPKKGDEKKVMAILKSNGPFSKRQLSYWRRDQTLSFDEIIKIKYPPYLIKLMNHEQQMNSFLEELEIMTESFCKEKEKRKQFFIKKVCQLFFSPEEKLQLHQMLGAQFGTGKEQNEQPELSGAKTLFKLLHFLFDTKGEDP